MKVNEIAKLAPVSQAISIISRMQNHQIVYTGIASKVPIEYARKEVVFIRAASDVLVITI